MKPSSLGVADEPGPLSTLTTVLSRWDYRAGGGSRGWGGAVGGRAAGGGGSGGGVGWGGRPWGRRVGGGRWRLAVGVAASWLTSRATRRGRTSRKNKHEIRKYPTTKIP